MSKRGHDSTVARDGRAALDAWREKHFDRILMDVRMPEMDDLDTTLAICAEELVGGRTPSADHRRHCTP
ncbi:MAG: response regulator [bacterium]